MATQPSFFLPDLADGSPSTAEEHSLPARYSIQKAVFDRADFGESKIGAYRNRAKDAQSDLPVATIPEFRPLKSEETQVFAATKEWEGTVSWVGKDSFSAELREVRSDHDEDQTDLTEIPLSDVPESDRALLREGAIFRYLVGYAKTYKGTVTRKRHVYVRRGKMPKTDGAEALWLSIAAKFRD